MSINLLGAAWEHGPRNPSLRILLMAYAEHADAKSGICWPSDKRLRDITGMSRMTIHRHRLKLIEDGYIELQPRRRNARGLLSTNTVRLIFSRIGLTTSQSDTSPSNNLRRGQTTYQSDTSRTPSRTKSARGFIARNKPKADARAATKLCAETIVERLTPFERSSILSGQSAIIDGHFLKPTDETFIELEKMLRR